ncbi:hypothetical protein C8J57DRAFT_1722311 [Mycena rebaudengoi]|nr:hypothetical protein C8J57DRAFT_1722311 [Mycena rebaudengoi]
MGRLSASTLSPTGAEWRDRRSATSGNTHLLRLYASVDPGRVPRAFGPESASRWRSWVSSPSSSPFRFIPAPPFTTLIHHVLATPHIALPSPFPSCSFHAPSNPFDPIRDSRSSPLNTPPYEPLDTELKPRTHVPHEATLARSIYDATPTRKPHPHRIRIDGAANDACSILTPPHRHVAAVALAYHASGWRLTACGPSHPEALPRPPSSPCCSSMLVGGVRNSRPTDRAGQDDIGAARPIRRFIAASPDTSLHLNRTGRPALQADSTPTRLYPASAARRTTALRDDTLFHDGVKPPLPHRADGVPCPLRYPHIHPLAPNDPVTAYRISGTVHGSLSATNQCLRSLRRTWMDATAAKSCAPILLTVHLGSPGAHVPRTAPPPLFTMDPLRAVHPPAPHATPRAPNRPAPSESLAIDRLRPPNCAPHSRARLSDGAGLSVYAYAHPCVGIRTTENIRSAPFGPCAAAHRAIDRLHPPTGAARPRTRISQTGVRATGPATPRRGHTREAEGRRAAERLARRWT